MITESELEAQAITWFQDTGWEFRHGPYIAPDGDAPERVDCRQVILTTRLLDALRRLQVPFGASQVRSSGVHARLRNLVSNHVEALQVPTR